MYTTKPDSPNCVFFLIDAASITNKIVVLTYHNGDKEWIAKEFDRVVDFLPCNYRLVYIRRVIYIRIRASRYANLETPAHPNLKMYNVVLLV